MNILFLTFGKIADIEENTIYCDLIREFIKNRHLVCTVSPGSCASKRDKLYLRQEFVDLDTVRGSGNLIKKGLSTILVEKKYLGVIKKKYNDLKFDLVIYTTPPITLFKAVDYVKKRDHAQTYLLLKDIFPQNAVDLGMMHAHGVKSLIYKVFRKKECQLYKVSDRIGCMSEANVDYVLKHNPKISPERVHVCPNSIEDVTLSISDAEKAEIRKKYDLPTDKKIFVYGGNLGKPQGIPFLIDCLRAEKTNPDAFFLIVGDGTEYGKLEAFVNDEKPANVKLMTSLPKEDYDRMIAACDVGLIFLDHRFTIPNFPSRLLSYMRAGVPVIACTDTATDIGKVISEGGFGWWCESNDPAGFVSLIDGLAGHDFSQYAEKERAYLLSHYTSQQSYDIIMANFQEKIVENSKK